MDYEEMLEQSRYYTDEKRRRISEELYDVFDENEKEIYSQIADAILETKFPDDYFRVASLEEMNREFGADGNRVITPRVRLALAVYLDNEQEFDSLMEQWDEIPDDD